MLKGGYVISEEQGNKPDVILIATGSEVSLALDAQEKLNGMDIDSRVVSMPCWELFRQQDDVYKNAVLPPYVHERVAVEAGSSFGWREWVGSSGVVLSVDRFGSSANYQDIFDHYGFTVNELVKKVQRSIKIAQT